MSAFAGLEAETELSRRYAAAQAWVGHDRNLSEAVVCGAALKTQTTVPLGKDALDAFEELRGNRPVARFADVLMAAHAAVGRIWVGAPVLPSPADVVARTSALVALLEGACATHGFTPASSPRAPLR